MLTYIYELRMFEWLGNQSWTSSPVIICLKNGHSNYIVRDGVWVHDDVRWETQE